MKLLKTYFLFFIAVVPFFGARPSFALTTLKKVQVTDHSQVDLIFDDKVYARQIKTEFVNDIIQLSLNDVSVYPAKITSISGAELTKVFAYQYAPKLVRCRFSVKGKADDFKNRISIKASGKIVTVRIGGVTAASD